MVFKLMNKKTRDFLTRWYLFYRNSEVTIYDIFLFANGMGFAKDRQELIDKLIQISKHNTEFKIHVREAKLHKKIFYLEKLN